MPEAAQAMVFSTDPEADRTFARDLLGLSCSDAGGGWIVFALPPGQSGIDALGDDSHQLYLECRSLDQAIAALAARGVTAWQVAEGDWGRAVSVALPGGGMIRLHEAASDNSLLLGGE
jgi:hypothetical protein